MDKMMRGWTICVVLWVICIVLTFTVDKRFIFVALINAIIALVFIYKRFTNLKNNLTK